MASKIKMTDVSGVSAGSLAFCLVGWLVLLAGAIFSKVKGGELVNALLGGEASVALVQASQDSVLTRVNETLGNETLGRSTVFLIWMFIGLSVYALATGAAKAARQIKDVNVRMHMVHQDKSSFTKMLAREWLFRSGVSLAWVVFTLLSLHIILPFFLASIAIVFGESIQVMDWLLVLLASCVILIVLHVHVILARLFFGRIRLFDV